MHPFCSYAVFEQRPLLPEIEAYCCTDVAHFELLERALFRPLPAHFKGWVRKWVRQLRGFYRMHSEGVVWQHSKRPESPRTHRAGACCLSIAAVVIILLLLAFPVFFTYFESLSPRGATESALHCIRE